MIKVSKTAVFAALANGVFVPIAVGLALFLEHAAISFANDTRWQSDSALAGWALNLVPAAVAGAAAYAAAVAIIHRVVVGSLRIPWFARDAIPLAVAAIFLALLLVSAPNNPDFWLFGQLLLWPLVALATGIAVEMVIAAIFRKRSRAAAA